MRIFALILVAVFIGTGPARSAEPLPTAPSVQILVSVADQKMRLVRDGQKIFEFPVSTSKFGEGDLFNSYRTPLGRFIIGQKIGDGLPAGAVLKRGRATGEVLPVNARGRDPVVTRILCLKGMDAANQNAEPRRIYIHGTPEENRLGKKASFGCIRMRSFDVIRLYAFVRPGTPVLVENLPLRLMANRIKAPRAQAPALYAGANFDRD